VGAPGRGLTAGFQQSTAAMNAPPAVRDVVAQAAAALGLLLALGAGRRD
jgi:hypothetical protein